MNKLVIQEFNPEPIKVSHSERDILNEIPYHYSVIISSHLGKHTSNPDDWRDIRNLLLRPPYRKKDSRVLKYSKEEIPYSVIDTGKNESIKLFFNYITKEKIVKIAEDIARQFRVYSTILTSKGEIGICTDGIDTKRFRKIEGER